MNNVSNFFRKVFICPNAVATSIPTTVLKGWLLNYCSICTFYQVGSSICSLGVQRKTVSTRWEHGKMDILFLSLIFLSKLLESLFVDFFPLTTIWTTSVLFWGAECFTSSVTWFPNIDSVVRNFGFTQAFFQEVFFLGWKMSMYNHIQWMSEKLSFLNVAHYQYFDRTQSFFHIHHCHCQLSHVQLNDEQLPSQLHLYHLKETV